MFAMDAFVQSGAHILLSDSLPDVEPIPKKYLLLWEKELIGLYVSDHPLQDAASMLARKVTAHCSELSEDHAGRKVTVGGIITSVRQILTRTEKPMAFAQLEDLGGTIEIVVFPKIYEDTKELWEEDRIVLVTGSVDCRDGTAKILADSVKDHVIVSTVVEDTDESGKGAAPEKPGRQSEMQITLNRTGDEEADIRNLEHVCDLLRQHPGEDSYTLAVVGKDSEIRLDLPDVRSCDGVKLQEAIRKALGTGSVQIT
jgi:DNA polymerase-3 subunit alpha